MTTDHRERRLREEYDRSHGHLRRYHDANPHVLSDPETYRRAHDLMTSEQARDLEDAGLYDREKFRQESGGRDPTPDEVHDHHLRARSHGGYGVRSAEQLIGHVHARLRPRRKDGTFA